jgi:diguanylate cyclase (GGDEF)-like protein/PAS domain S-box-containing protein
MTDRSTPNSSALIDLDAVRGIIDAVPHPIFIKDEQHRFVTMNKTMCDLMGRSFDELIGRKDHDFVPADQADVYLVNDQLVLDTGQVNENEEAFTGGDGGLRTIITRKNRLALAGGSRLIVGCITDITEFRRAEAQIRHNAEHDNLTGLANRALFHDRLRQANDEADAGLNPGALLIIDLDGFKNVNDLLGHDVGDNLLVQAAGILSALAGADDVVARLGGDEFAVIQRAAGQPAVAAGLAGKIVERLQKPMFLGARQVHISASVGIALLGRGADCETAMRHADLALYRAKKDGRNNWRLFEAEMEASYLVARFLEDDLRSALARGEFSIAYQGFVRAEDRKIAGFEALPRWNHPSRGTITPASFMPVAESTGIIAALGEWVLREACGTAATWSEPLRIAINVSPTQFGRSDLPEIVLGAVRDTGIDPRRIDLEVAESAIMRDMPGAERMVGALRKLGVNVVLDDFGAGYSSLHILKSLPFDRIKIDGSLLRDVGRSPQADAIVATILQLSRTLNLPVTAEGVETEDQVAVLRREGCNELQGFLFGEPTVAEPAVAPGSASAVKDLQPRKRA